MTLLYNLLFQLKYVLDIPYNPYNRSNLFFNNCKRPPVNIRTLKFNIHQMDLLGSRDIFEILTDAAIQLALPKGSNSPSYKHCIG